MQMSEWSARLESISAGYAEVYGVQRSPEWLLLKLTEELGELTQSWLAASGQGRTRNRSPEELAASVEHEVADVVATALLFARAADVDVEAALAAKWLPWEEFHRRRRAGDPSAPPTPLDANASIDGSEPQH